MKNRLFLICALGALASSAPAALTTSLVAYWNFEGNTDNSSIASGGAAFNGTRMGDATVTGAAKVGSGALSLDGAGDYLDVTSSVNVNQAWSVSAWFLPSAAPTGTVRGFVFETSSASYAMSFGIREGSPTTSTSFQLYTDTVTAADPNAAVQVDDASVIGSWHHILATYTPGTAGSAGTVSGYLDGTLQYTLTVPAGDSLSAATGFHIGTYRAADGRWFTGSIDEVAIWSTALSAGDALEVYNLGNNGQAIPEPASMGLGLLGLGTLLGRRRRASV